MLNNDNICMKMFHSMVMHRKHGSERCCKGSIWTSTLQFICTCTILYFQGGLFASKAPTFGTSTTASTAGFNFGAQPGSGSGLFAKPFSTPGFGTGFSTATTSTGFGGEQD